MITQNFSIQQIGVDDQAHGAQEVVNNVRYCEIWSLVQPCKRWHVEKYDCDINKSCQYLNLWSLNATLNPVDYNIL